MARAGGFFAPPARHDEQQQQQHHSHQPSQQHHHQQPQGAVGGGGGFVGGAGAGGASEGCERCGDPRPHAISPKWLSAFGVALCTSCRAADELVTKTAAKETYLVSDADLAPLGTLSRDNPRHRQFAPMRLYLASQVAAVAARKHGGAEGLQAARAARVGSKLEARAAKRRREQAREAAAERERARLEREAAARLAELEGEGEEEGGEGAGVKEEEDEEDEEEEEEEAMGGTTAKKTKKKKDKAGRSKGGSGKSEVVVDEATGRHGRTFGQGLAVVDEAEVEEI